MKSKLISNLRSMIVSQKPTNATLLSIYTKCGYHLPESIRKLALINTLETHVDQRTFKSPRKIISLDMGLKNMSMTRMNFPLSIKDKPIISQCIKLNLDPESVQFTPKLYSKITANFLLNYILNSSIELPSHVIIERQRYRTGGSKNVLEHTLKNNSIEGMIFMGLEMFNQLKNKDIEVIQGAPGSMVKYWMNQEGLKDLGDSETKTFRIELVLKWLKLAINDDKNSIFKLDSKWLDNICKLAGTKEWEKAWKFKAHSRKLWEIMRLLNSVNIKELKVNDELFGKMKGDDLADSLLHGMTLWEYEKNRKIFEKVILNNGSLNSFIL